MAVQPICPKCGNSRFELVEVHQHPQSIELICCSSCGTVVAGSTSQPDVAGMISDLVTIVEGISNQLDTVEKRIKG